MPWTPRRMCTHLSRRPCAYMCTWRPKARLLRIQNFRRQQGVSPSREKLGVESRATSEQPPYIHTYPALQGNNQRRRISCFYSPHTLHARDFLFSTALVQMHACISLGVSERPSRCMARIRCRSTQAGLPLPGDSLTTRSGYLVVRYCKKRRR